MEPFHIRLKKLRNFKRLTMKEVAEKIGVPVTTYREWEYGRAITGEPYSKIADALDVSLIELMTGKQADQNSLIAAVSQLEGQLAQIRKGLENLR